MTQVPLRPEIAAVAVPATTGGRNMASEDFAVTAGWGHYGQADAVMPGHGRAAERDFSPDERAALGDASAVIGERTYDIYLNDGAFWRNVPEPFGTIALAAIRSSRNGSPIENTRSLAAHYTLRRSGTSRTRRGELRRSY